MSRHGSMNRVYQVVWNVRRRVWQAAAETCGRQRRGALSAGGSGSVSRPSAPRVAAGALLLILIPFTARAGTLPDGGRVVAGDASIGRQGDTLTIDQSSHNAAIDWRRFSVGEGNTVRFNQPGRNAATLNRVTGGEVSSIRGAIEANGRVFLVNPNGVHFSSTARVDVGALVASTLDISTDDFMNGDYRFSGDSANAVINRGNIRTAQGGLVAMIAAEIVNTGDITTPRGSTLMGAGSTVTLDLGGPVSIEVEEARLDTLIEQGGAIRADGGLVYLTAKAAGDLAASVINHTGMTRARTLAAGENGEIRLMGDMDHGTVRVAGNLDASAPGSLHPEGGDGGFIETSAAKVKVADEARVTTRADQGKTGEWLIDPSDFTVSAGAAGQTDSGIGADTLSDNLANNSITLQTVASGAGNGDIFVNDAVTWQSGNTLTLNAHRDIEINATLDAAQGNGGKLALEYGQGSSDGQIDGRAAEYRVNAPVNLQAGQNFSTKIGSDGDTIDYTVITDLGAAGSTTGEDLQGMAGNLGGHYALGANIDASDTASWNGGAGFAPVGDAATAFTGTLDGLGHTISGLTIDRSDTDYVGLFGVLGLGSAVRNLGLVGGSVSGGGDYVGGLVGDNLGTIKSAYATGSVSGGRDVGGLVGYNRGTITSAYATGSVTGKKSVGGLVGVNNSATIENAHASVSVTGTDSVGGLVGVNYGTIENAYASGSVTGQSLVGGLAGRNDGTITSAYASVSVTDGYQVGGLVGSNGGTITSAYATGSVTGKNRVGGLVGDNLGTIKSAYATGSVEGSDSVGGLVGINSGKITSAYATGSVSGGGDYVGGLAGRSFFGTIRAAFFDTGTTGQSSGVGNGSGDVTGLTSTEMKNPDRFTNSGWDSSVWTFSGTDPSAPGYRITDANPFLTSVTRDEDIVGSSETLFEGGLGTADNPFTITSWEQLQNINYSSDTLTHGYDYSLSNNLGSGTAGYEDYASATANGGRGWRPIGDYANYSSINVFTGTFDGLGHIVSGLTINLPEAGFVGLFGVVKDGTVRNIGLARASVIGDYNVGGLVGWNRGTLDSVYATGSVKGGDSNVGGLVGQNDGTITNSYARGSVEGHKKVGGLVGYQQAGTISNAYATGGVNGSSNVVGGLVGDNRGVLNNVYATGSVDGKSYVGGLVGWNGKGGMIGSAYATGSVAASIRDSGGLVGLNDGKVLANTYWNTETTGQSDSAGGTGLTTAQMFEASRLAGFDFDAVWGNSDNQTTPWLRGLAGNRVFNKNDLPETIDDTNDRPELYTAILDIDQLQAMQNDLSGRYLLGMDIDAGHTENWNGGAGFVPLGNDKSSFTGTFDGLGHTISALTISRTGAHYIGLFGSSSGTIRNVGLVNASIAGGTYVGALVGANHGQIENAHATGGVAGANNVGGLVGLNLGSIKNVYSTATVTADAEQYASIGGLVGYNSGGTIKTAYATGSVTGNDDYARVGGLVGTASSGTIIQSYATGSVTGNGDRAEVGGLVASDFNATITQSFFAKETTGQENGADDGNRDGILALTTAEMKDAQNFADAGWDIDTKGGTGTTWRLYEGFTTPLLRTFLKQVTVTVNDKTGRTYDGTEATVSGSGHTLSDETASLLGNADYTDVTTRNAGDYALGISGLYSGQQGYDIKVETGRYTVDKAKLTLSAVTDSKTYDGDTKSARRVKHGALQGSDSLTGLSQSFDSKNAGDNRTLTVDSGYTLEDGNGGNNYTVTTTSANGSITRRKLTISGTKAAGKTYDGTATANITVGSLENLVGGETLDVTASGEFDEGNAGDRTATAHYTLANGDNGGLAKNYVLADTTGHEATIDRRVLTISGTSAANKAYDGTTTANITVGTLGNLVDGETLDVTASGQFDEANAGDRTATAHYTLANGDDGLASNYVLADTTGHEATINRRVLTVSGTSAADKTYDGTTSADITLGALGNLVDGENLNVSASGTFDSANAGERSATVRYTLADGDDGLASNYVLADTTGHEATINRRVLTVSGTSAADKTYDGTTSANITAGTLGNLVEGESLGVTASGTFESANAGDRTATAHYTLSDDSGLASNYVLADTTDHEATIDRRTLAISGTTAADKTYDGTTSANIMAGTLDNLVEGESLGVTASGTFDSANAGDRTATVHYTLSDDSGLASNYVLADTSGHQARISRREIGATISAADRVYDGTREASLSGALNERSGDTGLIGGDDLSLAVNGEFTDKNAGESKTVSYSDAALTGDDAGNYIFTDDASGTTTARISRREIGATVSAANRVYDGTRDASLSGALNERSGDTGLISGDDLSLAVSGEFTDKNAGADKAVSYSGAVLSGDDAGNYIFTDDASGTTRASITPRAVTVTADDQRKIAGVADPALTYRTGCASGQTVDCGLVAGESLAGALSRETGEEAGDYAILQGTVTEARNANYLIDFVPGELVVDFSAGRPLQGTLTALQGNTSRWGGEGVGGGGTPAASFSGGYDAGLDSGGGETVSGGLTLVRVRDEEGAATTRPGAGPLNMVVVGSGINTDSTDNSL